MPKFAKDHNSGKSLQNLFQSWSGYLLTIPYQLTKFQAPSSNIFSRDLAAKFEMPKFAKGSRNIWWCLFKRAITWVDYLINFWTNSVSFFPITWPRSHCMASVAGSSLSLTDNHWLGSMAYAHYTDSGHCECGLFHIIQPGYHNSYSLFLKS